MSQKQIFIIAQAPISLERLDSIGPGDEDVNTKGGRQTVVSVRTSDPAPAQGGTQIVVNLDVLIREGSSDYTTLSGRAVATINLESGMTFNSFGAGMRPANFSSTIHGKQHDWIDISNRQGIAGSILSWCHIKLDGKGDDNRGNARLNAHLAIPLVANVHLENPASHGQTNEGTSMLDPLGLNDLEVLRERQSTRLIEILKGHRPIAVAVAATNLPREHAERMRIPL